MAFSSSLLNNDARNCFFLFLPFFFLRGRRSHLLCTLQSGTIWHTYWMTFERKRDASCCVLLSLQLFPSISSSFSPSFFLIFFLFVFFFRRFLFLLLLLSKVTIRESVLRLIARAPDKARTPHKKLRKYFAPQTKTRDLNSFVHLRRAPDRQDPSVAVAAGSSRRSLKLSPRRSCSCSRHSTAA